MKPLVTITVRRAWHWGIAIFSDPSLGGQIPDVDPEVSVSANENGLVVLVRHAQERIEGFDGDFDWAEATVTVRHQSDAPPVDTDKESVHESTIQTPTGHLWIGDADSDVQMSGLTKSSRLRVLYPADNMDSPDRIWVDVWQA